jgi:DNA-binding GntR family transcriptional regulator
VVDDPRGLHEPYLARNRQILQTLQAGDAAEAEKLLAVYLDDSLSGLVEVYGERVKQGERADR